jgi:hypothetical protein
MTLRCSLAAWPILLVATANPACCNRKNRSVNERLTV